MQKSRTFLQMWQSCHLQLCCWWCFDFEPSFESGPISFLLLVIFFCPFGLSSFGSPSSKDKPSMPSKSNKGWIIEFWKKYIDQICHSDNVVNLVFYMKLTLIDMDRIDTRLNTNPCMKSLQMLEPFLHQTEFSKC